MTRPGSGAAGSNPHKSFRGIDDEHVDGTARWSEFSPNCSRTDVISPARPANFGSAANSAGEPQAFESDNLVIW